MGSRHFRRRRLAFEGLEPRELLSLRPVATLPAPATRSTVQPTTAPVAPAATVKTAVAAGAKQTPAQPAAPAKSATAPATTPVATSAAAPAASARATAPPASAPTAPAPAAPSPTAIYLQNFNPANYVRKGTDFTNFIYTPAGAAQRVGKPVAQINIVYDYDFAKVTAVEQELAGVDRLIALQGIFAKITAGATTDEAKQLAVLLFLQEASVHNGYLQPMYSDGTMVTDPLVLLELGEMRCGQVARVAVDLFSAAGYQARLVQLGDHVIAEIYYGQGWHYFDADLFGGGQCVFNNDGSIPSVAQLSQSPYLIDSLASNWEPNSINSMTTSAIIAPSYYYFSLQAWNAQFSAGQAPTPYVIYKTATMAQAEASRYYGWNYYKLVATPERQLYNMPVYYTPGAPRIQSVQTTRLADGSLSATISWLASPDPAGGVSYSLLVSDTSRGWNYDGQSLPAALMSLKSSNVPWNSSLYAARFTVPDSDVCCATTTATSITFTLVTPGKYYITVMPQDAHGLSVGRTLYPVSEELCITV